MTTHRRQTKMSYTISSAAVLSLLLIGLIIYLGSVTSPKQGIITRGVSVSGVPIGGLNRHTAQQVLNRRFERFLNQPVELVDGKFRYKVVPMEVGFKWDYDTLLDKALRIGREGHFWQRQKDNWQLSNSNKRLTLSVKVDEQVFASWAETVSKQVYAPPIAARVENFDEKVKIIPERLGKSLAPASLQHAVTVKLLDENRAGQLPVKLIKPEITVETLQSLGINKLVASFSTFFDAANVNRSQNIAVAANAIDHVLIKGGETFSYNRTISERAQQEDFREAPVIIEGQFVEGRGGGICQVSTTLYNAALLANLKIVERNHHSQPVSYVPIGMDATVAGDYLDLKLAHQKEGAFLIATQTGKGYVRVLIYSNDLQRAKVHLEQSPLEIVEPPVQVIKDPNFVSGKTFMKEGKKGYKITTWRIINNNGGTFSKEFISKDFYKPSTTEVRKGTGR